MARLLPALPKRALLLSLSLAAADAVADGVFQARCEGRLAETGTAARRSTVSVEAHDSGYRIDNSLSYRTLTRIKRPGPEGGYVLGLTRAESRVAISVQGSILDDPDSGRECLLPQVGISLSYLPIVVYVGREFAPGSCAYREILAHEMRHLKAYVEYLPKVESRVRATLERGVGASPVYAPRGQALARVKQELDGQWMPFIKREMAKGMALQAGIDSPAEYARLGKLCQGEVQSLIRSTRRSSPTTGS